MLDSIIFCSTLAAGWFIVLSTPQPYCLCLSPTSTFVNWALPANKLRIMCCFFITNMLEEHRPIKGGIFCVEWWGRHWCRKMWGVGWRAYYGNELTMLKLWLYYHVCSPPPVLLTDDAQHTPSISQSHQRCNSKIRIWTEYHIDISVQVLHTDMNFHSPRGGFKWRFLLYQQL